MSAPKAQQPISKDALEGIYRLEEKVDKRLFQQTFNDFIIMGGILPDMPIGMRPGMVKINGVWQYGVLYSQYYDWKDHIGTVWKDIATEDFGVIYGSKN